jgi:hypothetical protein
MSAEAAEPEGTTPAMPQNKSFKEAELDPRAEAEPEEGEAAA